METIATDNNGSYPTVKEPKQLQEVEASIPTTEVNCAAFLSAANGHGHRLDGDRQSRRCQRRHLHHLTRRKRDHHPHLHRIR